MIISSLEKKMIKLRPRISILFKQYLKELLQPNYTTHTHAYGVIELSLVVKVFCG